MNLIWILIQIHVTIFYEKNNYLYFMTQALKDNDLFRVSRGGSKKNKQQSTLRCPSMAATGLKSYKSWCQSRFLYEYRHAL